MNGIIYVCVLCNLSTYIRLGKKALVFQQFEGNYMTIFSLFFSFSMFAHAQFIIRMFVFDYIAYNT
jgi:succinate dehydrogenase hydrophobic anchor subunit